MLNNFKTIPIKNMFRNINSCKSLTIKINWSLCLSVAIFWLLAFNDYPSNSGIRNVNYVGKVFFLVLFFFFCKKIHDPAYTTIINLKLSLAEGFLFFLVFLWGFAGPLQAALVGDEIYHASYASRHAQLLIHWVNQELPILWPSLSQVAASSVIRVVHLAIVAYLFCFFYFLPKKFRTHPYRLALALTITLVLTWLVFSSRANIFHKIEGPFYACQLHQFGLADPHPLLRQLPLLLASAFFGVSPAGYHAAGFLAFCLFLLFVYIRFRDQFGAIRAVTGTLLIGTTPVFLDVAVLAEQSVWAAIAGSIVFFQLARDGESRHIALIPLASIIVLASLQRAPAFLATFPLLLWASACPEGRRNFARELPKLAPILLMLIWIIVITGLKGSPALQQPARPWWAWFTLLNEKIPDVAAVSVLGLLPVMFLGVLLVRPACRLLTCGALLFIAACSYLYFVPLRDVLWGVSRYQAEIFVPLFVAAVAVFLEAVRNQAGPMSLLPLLVILGTNLLSLHGMDARTFRPFPQAPLQGEAIRSAFRCPLKEAFSLVRDRGWQTGLFYVGVYYGGFASILQKYSVGDYVEFSILNNRHRLPSGVDILALNQDNDVQVVMVEPEEAQGVPQALIGLGWKELPPATQAHTDRNPRIFVRFKEISPATPRDSL